jgi:hypothetical protein
MNRSGIRRPINRSGRLYLYGGIEHISSIIGYINVHGTLYTFLVGKLLIGPFCGVYKFKNLLFQGFEYRQIAITGLLCINHYVTV